ncbi:MAG TPA: hypothetical protein VLA56_20455, partial [Pseudomonadales bacterium]|nr:hypothetical protein [Pseudomonadales bacterium]
VPSLLIAGVFPQWVSSVLVLAMVAAAMSSLDSVLLVAASTLNRDLIGARRAQTDRHAVRRTRGLVIALCALTAALAWRPPGGIVELTIWSGSLYAACFLPVLLGGLFTRRGDAPVALVSMLLGLATLLVWPFTPGDAVVHEVFPALGASTLAFALGCRLRPKLQAPAAA